MRPILIAAGALIACSHPAAPAAPPLGDGSSHAVGRGQPPQATMLHAQGARVIIAAMHIGSCCKDLDDPDDVSSCNTGGRIAEPIAVAGLAGIAVPALYRRVAAG